MICDMGVSGQPRDKLPLAYSPDHLTNRTSIHPLACQAPALGAAAVGACGRLCGPGPADRCAAAAAVHPGRLLGRQPSQAASLGGLELLRRTRHK